MASMPTTTAMATRRRFMTPLYEAHPAPMTVEEHPVTKRKGPARARVPKASRRGTISA